MPVEEHEVHEKVRIDADKPYGCHSRSGLSEGYIAHPWSAAKYIKHRMSTACRNFYLWDVDPRCGGCTTQRDNEYADKMKGLE